MGLDGGLAAPRRVGRQVHRNAVPGDTAEKYYRRHVFIPFLDDVRQALRLRFEHKPVYALQLLIPGCRTTEGDHVNEIMRVAEVYQEDLDVALSVVHGEVKTWVDLTKSLTTTSLPDCLEMAKRWLLPSVGTLLRLYATLPVSSSSAERAFSKMKHLVTYVRTTMGQERLSNLSILAIHRKLASNIDLDQIVDAFKATKDRRVLL